MSPRDGLQNEKNFISTNDKINIFELEGEIDNFFNWFIYVNKLINNLKGVDLSTIKSTSFYTTYYNKKIVDI